MNRQCKLADVEPGEVFELHEEPLLQGGNKTQFIKTNISASRNVLNCASWVPGWIAYDTLVTVIGVLTLVPYKCKKQ